MLIMDIDDFKNVNDTHGHIMGDYVLKELGKCVMENIKQTDMAFRYGGEEFAVLLPASGPSGGMYVAERIRSSVESQRFEKDGITLRMTVSIGVSNCPKSANAVEDLIRTADKALYEAKISGKNRVVESSVKAN